MVLANPKCTIYDRIFSGFSATRYRMYTIYIVLTNPTSVLAVQDLNRQLFLYICSKCNAIQLSHLAEVCTFHACTYENIHLHTYTPTHLHTGRDMHFACKLKSSKSSVRDAYSLVVVEVKSNGYLAQIVELEEISDCE